MSYSKSFVKVCLTLSKTIKNVHFSWGGPYICMRWAILKAVCKNTFDSFPNHQNLWFLLRRCLHFQVSELLEVVCKSTLDPFQNHRNLSFLLRRSLHFLWDELPKIICKKYAWPSPNPWQSLILAETVLTCLLDELPNIFLWKVRLTQSQPIRIFDFSWDGPYFFMKWVMQHHS